MKRSMLLVLALTAAAYAVLFVYCGTALGLPLHAVDLTLHLVLLAGDIVVILLGKALGTLRCAARNFARCGAVALRIWIDHALYYRIGFPVPLLCLLGIAVLLAVLAALPLISIIRRKTKKSLKPDSLDLKRGTAPRPLSCGAAMLLEPSAFVPVMRIRVAPSGRKIRMRQARPRR